MGVTKKVTVAAVQAAPVVLDRDATIAKAVSLIGEAASGGAQLIVFPETWVPTYPQWIYGNTQWEDAPSHREFARLLDNSVSVPSPATDVLCKAARSNGVTLAIGINERDTRFSRGTIYNSILYISSAGEIMGVHRKLMPTMAERCLWGQGDGSTLHVFDTELGRLGGLVCWEHWMPLTTYAMHAQAESVHVALWPAANADDAQLAARYYAFAGRTFVVSVGSHMALDDYPEDFELREAAVTGAKISAAGTDPDAHLAMSGGSGIIGPDGQWIAGPADVGETIVYAEIDLGRVAEEQQALDVAGHYSRPDVFDLRVNTKERSPVTFGDCGAVAGPAETQPAHRGTTAAAASDE